MVGTDKDFEVEIDQDGSVRVSGKAAANVLMSLAMAAKFETELKAEILLSPYVNQLISTLAKALPTPTPLDWNNSAILTPPGCLQAVEQVRRYRDLHEPHKDLAELVTEAMQPFDLPLSRLGL